MKLRQGYYISVRDDWGLLIPWMLLAWSQTFDCRVISVLCIQTNFWTLQQGDLRYNYDVDWHSEHSQECQLAPFWDGTSCCCIFCVRVWNHAHIYAATKHQMAVTAAVRPTLLKSSLFQAWKQTKRPWLQHRRVIVLEFGVLEVHRYVSLWACIKAASMTEIVFFCKHSSDKLFSSLSGPRKRKSCFISVKWGLNKVFLVCE